jgi:hypothetical protein
MAKMFAWHALQSLCYTLRAHGIDFKRLRRHKRRSVFLTLSVVRSFIFWYHLSPYLRSAPIASLAVPPSISVYGATDACDKGGGFIIGSHWSHYQFVGAARDYHITYKEAHAICILLRSHSASLTGRKICLFVDNYPLVQAFARRWSPSACLMQCVWELIFLSTRFCINLYLDWIPGIQNVAADALSRDDIRRFCDYAKRHRWHIDQRPLRVDPHYQFMFPLYGDRLDSDEMSQFKRWLFSRPADRSTRWWMPSLAHLIPSVPPHHI